MMLAPWRSLLSGALHRNRSEPHSRYLQLATIQADGRPANRTLVFRGFLDNTNQLKFVTDSRSQKADQIEHHPWAEACWYFTTTREQFRLAGTLTLVGANHPDSLLQQARQVSWQDLSDAARLQFAWPHPRERRADVSTFSPPPPDPQKPLESFCLLLLEPVQVDHLELRGDPQNRCLYRLESSQAWSIQAVNP